MVIMGQVIGVHTYPALRVYQSICALDYSTLIWMGTSKMQAMHTSMVRAWPAFVFSLRIAQCFP